MSKAPASQVFWGDISNDVELQLACSATRGIWWNALCKMWYAKIRGELTGTATQLIRLLNCKEEEFITFLNEAHKYKFCDMDFDGADVTFPLHVTHDNVFVTLRNRRMYREEKTRQATRQRVATYRERKQCNAPCNDDVTHTSSSSSSLKEKDIQNFTFPLRGNVIHELGYEKIKEYQKTYPNIDVMQCLRECVQWNEDNPGKRKTKTGILKHINTWLKKEKEKKGYIASAPQYEDRTGKEPEQLTPEQIQKNKELITRLATGVGKAI